MEVIKTEILQSTQNIQKLNSFKYSNLSNDILEHIISFLDKNCNFIEYYNSLLSLLIIFPQLLYHVNKLLILYNMNNIGNMEQLNFINSYILSMRIEDLQPLINIYGIEQFIIFCSNNNYVMYDSACKIIINCYNCVELQYINNTYYNNNNCNYSNCNKYTLFSKPLGIEFMKYLIKNINYKDFYNIVTKKLNNNQLSNISKYMRIECVDEYILYILIKKVFPKSFRIYVKNLSYIERADVLKCIIKKTSKNNIGFIDYAKLVCVALLNNYTNILTLLFENYIFKEKNIKNYTDNYGYNYPNNCNDKFSRVYDYIIENPQIPKSIIKYYLELLYNKLGYNFIKHFIILCIDENIKNYVFENMDPSICDLSKIENINLLPLVLLCNGGQQFISEIILSKLHLEDFYFEYLVNYCNIIYFIKFTVLHKYYLSSGINDCDFNRYMCIIDKINIDKITNIVFLENIYEMFIKYYSINRFDKTSEVIIPLSILIPLPVLLKLPKSNSIIENQKIIKNIFIIIQNNNKIIIDFINEVKKFRKDLEKICSNINSIYDRFEKIPFFTEMFNYCIINIEYLLSLKTLTMLMYKKLIKLNIDIKDDEYIESYQLLLTIKKLKSIILTHSPDLIELDNIVG
jgi:hypothetical protein